jgi:hypothetical protein
VRLSIHDSLYKLPTLFGFLLIFPIWDRGVTVEVAFIDYFRNIFKTSCPTGIPFSLEALPCRVSHEMNVQLLREFTKEEVWAALQQMAPLKSPGPDGFLACFYQDQWVTVGPEVCEAILNFVKGGSFDENVNFTHVVLIPKTR